MEHHTVRKTHTHIIKYIENQMNIHLTYFIREVMCEQNIWLYLTDI